jgi:hypothetical protein
MKNIFIALLAAALMLTTTPVVAQTAKDAIKSLKKVEAVASTNIYGKEFLSAYSDAQAEVDMYVENPQSNKKPDMKQAIEQTALSYKWATSMWKLKMKKVPYIHTSDEYVQSLYRDFPAAKDSLKGTIMLDNAIAWLYGNASAELFKATKLLYK